MGKATLSKIHLLDVFWMPIVSAGAVLKMSDLTVQLYWALRYAFIFTFSLMLHGIC